MGPGLRGAISYLRRPYRVTPAMVALVSLVPLYIFIPAVFFPGRAVHVPALQLDTRIPLQPGWVFAYGALYLFLIVLPVLVVRDQLHIRRTVWAYLSVWLSSYAIFLSYPTVASRPDLAGNGFGVWGLGLLYSADPPFNCFPSLHVAHSFVSAFTCLRIHRRLGLLCSAAALVVAVSTLFTKQHYILDAVAGFALASTAYLAFLHTVPLAFTEMEDRQAVAVLAVGLLALMGTVVVGAWAIHWWRVG